jgi:pyruvate,water dikinase
LGENIVQGAVTPDEFLVHKPTMLQGFESIISKKLGSKNLTMIYDNTGNKNIKNIQTPINKRKQFILNDQEILTLAKWTTAIEEYYTKKRNKYTPMDMEWAKDGETNELFVVQARPETIQSQRDFSILAEYKLTEQGKILATGQSVGSKI